MRFKRGRDEAAAIVQEPAEDPGKAVQEAEAGKGTGASHTNESSACQEATRRLRSCDDRLGRQVKRVGNMPVHNPGVAAVYEKIADLLEIEGSNPFRIRGYRNAARTLRDLTRQKQTERILRVMDRPCFTILAHPSGRLIEERAPYDVNMARLIRHAREQRGFLEVNTQPVRLDLTDTDCQMAKEEGVMLSVNSDAHSVLDFGNLWYGIGQALRGWLEKEDVLNARPLHSPSSAPQTHDGEGVKRQV
ncbi:MAG TPA: PHP domain-containing protein [Nitrospira sp.]|nr:PHP domain-containing protein [Nitrospira sp.]